MKTISRYLMTLVALFAMTTGAWADGDTKYTVTFKANGNTKTVENVTLPHTFTSVNNQGNGELDLIINDLYNQSEGWCVETPTVSGNSNVTAGLDGSYNQYITISAPFEGNATVSGSHFYDNPISSFTYTLEISVESPSVDVTISDDKTEASFEMPTYDLTVDYELVRDMSVQMQAQVGDDPAKQPRYRVQWNDEKKTFEPAEMEYEEVMKLFSVKDLIEEGKKLAPINYLVNIYAVDAEGKPTGDAMDFKTFTFAPGRYCVTASANTLLEVPVPYEGTTAPSNIFELYQGYQVVIPAGEYATYYKDEALKVEDQEVELLTITAVEDGKAVLSDASDAMPKNTPFLVHNNSTEEKTILLIPCNEPDLAITWADEFIGTLTEKTFTDQDMGAGADFYVCNGKEFIKVRGAGTLAANKAYLKVTGNAPASIPFRRSIDGGEGTTGVDLIDNGKLIIDNDGWYDLNGRRLQGKPSQKGVYIKNGKKIVVK